MNDTTAANESLSEINPPGEVVDANQESEQITIKTEVSSGQEARVIEDENIVFTTDKLNLFYGEKQALNDIDISIPEKRVTAFIGPSGCGKSTLLRCFKRMN